MKRILLFLFVCSLIAGGCEDDYKLSTDFTAPETLINPVPVQLDLASTRNVVFAWDGGGAADGGVVLYEVLFDKEEGNFSEPLYRVPSDLGGQPHLTMTHVMLNKMARIAGIKTGQTGSLKWTVYASRGGVVKQAATTGKVTLTRPVGLEVPEALYLYGSAAENGESGQAFRMASDGVFVIYTTLPADGNLYFAGDQTERAVRYYIDANGELKEGEAETAVTKRELPVRLTVNFNTKVMTIEEISGVRLIWGTTFATLGNLQYVGNGVFQADNVDVKFISPDRPDTNPPSWLTWVEERYYFIATIEGAEWCWGRMDNVSADRPTGSEPLSFYELGEFTWSQWEHLWKMSGDLDMTSCTVSIHTNLEGLMVHQFTNVRPL